MLFKKLSTTWAESLARISGETDTYKIAMTRYVFETILAFFLSVSVLIIVARLFGVLTEALLIATAGQFFKTSPVDYI